MGVEWRLMWSGDGCGVKMGVETTEVMRTSEQPSTVQAVVGKNSRRM
jgi:hypothetical protein